MKKQIIVDKCAICGNEDILTFEHIPPQKAFNDQKYYILSHEEGIDKKYDEPIAGKKPYQGGIGLYTLCKTCNNKTGRWYGTSYVNFAHQGMMTMIMSKSKPTLIYLYHISPLQIIKQIISMFLSVNHKLNFVNTHSDLAEFVLNKERRLLDKKYKVWAYYKGDGQVRYSHLTFSQDISKNNEMMIYSDIAYPPFGFVLTMNSKPPDDRLVDITHFASYKYSDWVDVELRLPVLDTFIPIGGFYPTKKDLEKAYEESEKNTI